MPTIAQLLHDSRRELLDLTTRNRLLSMPAEGKSARVVRVQNESCDMVFEMLVREKKSLSFLPAPEKQEDKGVRRDKNWLLSVADGDDQVEDDAGGRPERHRDKHLQTGLSPEMLQRRLLSLYRDARTMEEEQGVNILYLALGRVKWLEAGKSDTPRYAPLILVPVGLRRKSARDRFSLSWTEEDPQANLSLEAKLNSDFGIRLPGFGDDEEVLPSVYMKAVRKAVSGQTGWEVDVDAITLGFFSFAKFLMYRDLDPANWPEHRDLGTHPLLTSLLRDGFPAADRPFPDATPLDELIPVTRLDHVVDADSSQTVAIERVRRGENLVIQGPPGTGKSQSICNVIATAVLDGKRVLFVAEKMVALDVVRSRLQNAGLGDLCLELHSHKAHKRAVLDQIGRTWQLGIPTGNELESLVSRLEETRARLNTHASILHDPLLPSGWTPYRIMGQLAASEARVSKVMPVMFPNAEKWTADGIRQREGLVQEIAERLSQIGTPSMHPWRGVQFTSILAIDLPPLEAQLRQLVKRLDALLPLIANAVQVLAVPSPSDFSHAELLRRMMVHLSVAPPMDSDALCNNVWQAGLGSLDAIVADGRRYAQARSELGARIVDSAWEMDHTAARTAIALHGESWLSFLYSDFRAAKDSLRTAMTQEPPWVSSERLAILDKLLAGQKALRAIRAGDETGRKAFGSLWRAENSNWDDIAKVLEWVRQERSLGLDATVREKLKLVSRNLDFKSAADTLSSALDDAWKSASSVVDTLKLDPQRAFGAQVLDHVSMEVLKARALLWIENLEELSRWCSFEAAAQRARQLDLGPLLVALDGAVLDVAEIHECFRRSLATQLMREVARQRPSLAQFDGVSHDRHVEAFRKLDSDRLALARYRTLASHHQSLPQRQGVGATGLVMGELQRQRGLRPVRKLLADAGSVVQAIKPVFMMSPLSVAQYLAPGSVEFDLLVIDEASQVQPVDALGAMARAKQIVVVGDSKQLPPTRFFARMTSDEEPDEPDAASDTLDIAAARDVESILGLCSARGLPETMLRWHYRSRHHSLIAVSNREFYESKLFIVPSPHIGDSGFGLRFHYVSEGRFDAGASSTNRIEAERVCQAILKHARENPELTLGVAAFSVKQRDAIEDELERQRQANPDTEAFFNSHAHEKFFLKNLENVQGDERDVIFISVGYGKDNSGFFAMRFGPLSSDGGERRLNVLISRAKKRCEVFSSIKAEDIDLQRARGRGVQAFKNFLAFAETGRMATPQPTDRGEDSPFEEAVRLAVEGLGYEVHPQVGMAGFFIDLGVIDPRKPGRYLLGIECDGATYHSSRSARDRDRLRQAVLEDHGWSIHRIWSTDWFQRPGEQLRKVHEALERAKIAAAEGRGTPARPGVAPPVIPREPEKPVSAGKSVSARPYAEAYLPRPSQLEPHEVTSKVMSDFLHRIVTIEAPIHEDELLNRARDLWGIARAGTRVQRAVSDGLRLLLRENRVLKEENCILLPGQAVMVRNRSDVSSSGLKKPEFLPPQEIRQAMLEILAASHGASESELATSAGRLLGFQNISANLRQVLGDQVQSLIAKGSITPSNGMLVVNSPVKS